MLIVVFIIGHKRIITRPKVHKIQLQTTTTACKHFYPDTNAY